jgi:metal-responsive CopG/Arc/MetJ family transcriptional regulator
MALTDHSKWAQRVNVDFTQEMLQELDIAARELNVSRQAVIKIFIRQALNRHYLAQKARDAR